MTFLIQYNVVHRARAYSYSYAEGVASLFKDQFVPFTLDRITTQPTKSWTERRGKVNNSVRLSLRFPQYGHGFDGFAFTDFQKMYKYRKRLRQRSVNAGRSYFEIF